MRRTFARPDIKFFCDIHYDPFLYMQDHGKVYGEHTSLVQRRVHLFIAFLLQALLFPCMNTRPRSPHSGRQRKVRAKERIACAQCCSVHWFTGRTFRSIEFLNGNPGLVAEDNAMAFLSDDGGETYNRCHCELYSLCHLTRSSEQRKL